MATISSSTRIAPTRPKAQVTRSIRLIALRIEDGGLYARRPARRYRPWPLLQLGAIERGGLPALHELALAGQHLLEPAAFLRHGPVLPRLRLLARGLDEGIVDHHDLVTGLLQLDQRVDVAVVELQPGVERGQLAGEFQQLLLAIAEAVPGRLAEHALLRRGGLVDAG